MRGPGSSVTRWNGNHALDSSRCGEICIFEVFGDASVAQRLVATFGINRDRAERDVGAFLAELDEQGFLER